MRLLAFVILFSSMISVSGHAWYFKGDSQELSEQLLELIHNFQGPPLSSIDETIHCAPGSTPLKYDEKLLRQEANETNSLFMKASFEQQIPRSFLNDNIYRELAKCGITYSEYMSTYLYSWQTHKKVKAILRGTETLSDFRRKYFDIYVDKVNSLLSKLKKHDGIVVRSTNELPEQIQAQHEPGKIVYYPAFTSTGLKPMFENFGSAHVFYMHTRTCAYINPISRFGGEQEVLCPAGTRFKVHSKITSRGINYYLMEEIP